MKLDYLDTIYYINLNRDINKNNYFLHIIKDSILNGQCERFIGIDGSLIDLRILPDNIITDKAINDIQSESQRIYGVSLTYGALGCALSHRLIYEECSKSSKPFLVLEDDIVLCDDFNHKIIELINKIKTIDYDLCYIGYNDILGFKKEQINTVLSKPSGLITGTYGYFLSPNGAKKLLNTIFPLAVQIDSSISNNIDNFNIFCSSAQLVTYTNKFGSKTQQNISCENVHRLSNINNDSWYSLFDE